jgi:uncharacterized membrane protein
VGADVLKGDGACSGATERQEAAVMWWGSDGYWVRDWSWPGLLIAALVMIACMVMMARMMGHGMGTHHARGSHDRRDERPEDTLATRLARGELDIDEYDRLRDALRQSADSPRG